MIKIQADLCIGCGRCAESCPRRAISIVYGQAQINQGWCNQCHVCLNICPQGAIVKIAPVSEDELEATVSSLKHRANELIERIESLRRSR
jgi:ferredoxin